MDSTSFSCTSVCPVSGDTRPLVTMSICTIAKRGLSIGCSQGFGTGHGSRLWRHRFGFARPRMFGRNCIWTGSRDNFVSRSPCSTCIPGSKTYRSQDGPPTPRRAVAFLGQYLKGSAISARRTPATRLDMRPTPERPVFAPNLSLSPRKSLFCLVNLPSASKATQVVASEIPTENTAFSAESSSKAYRR